MLLVIKTPNGLYWTGQYRQGWSRYSRRAKVYKTASGALKGLLVARPYSRNAAIYVLD